MITGMYEVDEVDEVDEVWVVLYTVVLVSPVMEILVPEVIHDL